MIVGEDAIEQLPQLIGVGRGDGTLVVMDANTREAAGIRTLDTLPAAHEFVFPQRSGLLAGMDEVAAVRERARSATRLVAVGSGVITDIVRYAAHLDDRPFISVPTAASMDGYTSSVAAMQIDGVKVTYPARAPLAVLADPRVAAAAPLELTRAGLGDLLAKATAQVDWLAAHLLYGEAYVDRAAERVLAPLRFAAGNAEQIVAGRPDATRQLLVGLIESGIAMAIVGNSRPASGCEHHASHFWDLLAARGIRSHASHGLQVGYATRFAMRLQRYALAGGLPVLRAPSPARDPLGPAAREWLGEPSQEIIAAVSEKQRMITVPGDWPSDAGAWSDVRELLAPALDMFGDVERALDHAGIPDEPGYLEIDHRTLGATFRYATRLRARWTVVDLLESQQMLDAALAATLPAAEP